MPDLQNSVETKIAKVFEDALGLNLLGSVDLSHEHFFGNRIALAARDLISIVFQIEKIFSLKFKEEDFLNENFYCLKGMSRIVYTIQKKQPYKIQIY